MTEIETKKADEIKAKIDRYIELDKTEKESKKEKEIIKAELQAEGLTQLENKNIKQIDYFGTMGNCTVGYTEKLKIDNYKVLSDLIKDMVNLDEQITREESIKITPCDNFKKALIVLYKGEYKQHDIKEILKGLNLNDKQIKVALKQLKGDYNKDKALFEKFELDSNNLEEELDAIREHKNYELIEKYFNNIEAIKVDEIKRTLTLEESLSIGFKYETE